MPAEPPGTQHAPRYLHIAHILEHWARHTPDAPALLAPERIPLTYKHLHRHVHDIMQRLRALGVSAKDRVAVDLPAGPEMAVAFLSVAVSAGCVPLNPASSTDELHAYFAALGARTLLVLAGSDTPARAVAQTRSMQIIELWPIFEAAAGLFTLTGTERPHAAYGDFTQPHDVALVLPTSGTTSRSKIVPLTHSNICTVAHNIRNTLALVERDRCLNVLPFFHVHGLLVAILTSLVAGASCINTAGFSPTTFFAAMAEFHPTWYTAVPTIHQAILANAAPHLEIIAACPLRFIRSASAPLPRHVLEELETVFQGPVIEAYGMTETSGPIASNPLPPRLHKPGSVGVAAGAEVAIMSPQGMLLPTGATGEVVARGPTVFQGYENDPTANNNAFINGWFRTGDQGFLDRDGYLFITGRLQEIINRGGEKFALQEVDNVLLEHPAVAQAVAFAVPHARLGEDIAAAVVLHPNAVATEHEIRLFVATRLAAFKVPHRVAIVKDLPQNTTGKLQRLGLADQLGLTAPPSMQDAVTRGDITPHTAFEELLAELWAQVLGSERVGIHDNFFWLGGDSILATQLVSRMREILHVEVSLHSVFQTPTAAGMARSIAVARQGQPHLPAPPLQPVPSDSPLPLSYAQQRLWFLNQLEPGSSVYNLPIALRLTGALNIPALEKSLDAIVQRHAILRTSFPAQDGQPSQSIVLNLPVLLPVVDLQTLPQAARETAIHSISTTESQRAFDLAQGPLWRVLLLRLDDQEHVFLLNMHHIIFDGWSFDVFFRELTALYTAFSQGLLPALPALPLQYSDFALWQQAWLQGTFLEGQLAYWKEQLADRPVVLEIPTDWPRPSQQSFRGACQSFALTPHLTAALKVLSRQESVTLFMTLLAAFQTLLYRYTGQVDLLVGTPIAGRTRVEIESLIGFFVNTLALRTRVRGNASFRELLAQVCQVALEAYDHQEIPFDKLVDELRIERSPAHEPLVQVMFALQNASRLAPTLPGLTLAQIAIENGTAKFDLTLSMRDTAQGLQGTFEYATDLFDHTTITRMIGHFQTLLASITAHPEHRLTDLPLLTAAERQQILVEWQGTITPATPTMCLHEHVAAWAAQTPTACAVVCNGQQLTYATLNRRANQLAHYLQATGIGPEVGVGLCMERSPDIIVALLAILKAGGAYVPLDPTYPPERLAFLLSDTQVPVVVTQHKVVQTLPTHAAQLVCLDTDWEQIAQQSEENPASSVTPANLAYVLYTSGSTGQPKGVMIEHRQVLACLDGFEHIAPGGAECTGTAVCPLSFDVAVWECFAILCFGGTLHLLPESYAEPRQFAHYLVAHGITSAYIPPALLSDVASHLEQRDAPLTLNRLLVGTEPIPQGLLQRFRNLSEDMRIINGYGPTETTICATLLPFAAATGPARRTPIGTGIRGYEVYLVDASMQPVPIGIPGELHIGGVGLARGYLNRPQLNAEKFIPHPFRNNTSSRLYKTGDLARYLPDGNLEFLGRLDHQIKIRGFRIEPGEIEAVLTGLPVVQANVVMARAEPNGNTQLVAYVVPNANGFPSQRDLQTAEHLAHWQALFEETYGHTAVPQDRTFHITGWNSSYTGLPLPAEEMREWVDHTVARLLALQPDRVLEIGCGTGLLLSRVAPHCSQYWGTDFSTAALQYLQEMLRSSKALQHVTLLHKMADDFQDLAAEAFDTVILNSVIQYFPNIDYLFRVLEGAMHVVSPGGSLFLGDVRSLPLLKAYHAAVQYAQADTSLSAASLQQRLEQSLLQEEELVIDPAFFYALKQRFPQIGAVQIQPKRGRHPNELTQFRYDVLLRIGTADALLVEPAWLDWRHAELTLADVYHMLTETQPATLGLHNVPNARVQREIYLLEWLANAARTATVGDFHNALAHMPQAGIDPELFWSISSELPYDIDISWAAGSAHGCYDVVCKRRPAAGPPESTPLVPHFATPGDTQPWSAYANHPLQKNSSRQLILSLRRALKEKLPDYMIPHAFVVLDALPLTPNGKIDRQALPAPHMTDMQTARTFVAPRTTAERILAGIWATVLGIEQVGVHDNFFELGGDSILSMQIIARANQAGLHMTSKHIFQHQTIAELATVAYLSPSIQAEQDLVTGPLPCTPIQRWFFEQDILEPHHWNQAMWLEVPRTLDVQTLEEAVQYLLAHHDMLRARFQRAADGWQQEIAPLALSALCLRIDLAVYAPAQQDAQMAQTTAQLQASLHLQHGPLIRLALFDRGLHKPARLLLIIHHLVVDHVSWHIVLEDLQTAYQQLSTGQKPQLPPKTTSFQHWAERLMVYAQSAALRQELAYWLSAPTARMTPLPIDTPQGANTVALARTVALSLGPAETDALLRQLPRLYQTQMNDVLLTAFVQTLACWTGEKALLLDLEGHGREEIVEGIDLSRTVGWFTTLFPVLLQLGQADTPIAALKSIKEQLRSIPRRGIGYGVLRYLCQETDITQQLRALPQAEVSFNYLGQVPQTMLGPLCFAPIPEASGPHRSPRGQRRYLLEVNCRLLAGQLQCNWTYSEQLHRRSTIAALAQGFLEALRTLVTASQSPRAAGFTPSDFPKMQLNQQELNELMAALEGSTPEDS